MEGNNVSIETYHVRTGGGGNWDTEICGETEEERGDGKKVGEGEKK